MDESNQQHYKTYDKISRTIKAKIYRDFICEKNIKIKQLALIYPLHYTVIGKIIMEIGGPDNVYFPKVIILSSAV